MIRALPAIPRRASHRIDVDVGRQTASKSLTTGLSDRTSLIV